VRFCLTMGCAVVLVMAFVAPVPASLEAERIKAIESAPSLMGHRPNIGPFQWSVAFEYDGRNVTIAVSGQTYLERGMLIVAYTESFWVHSFSGSLESHEEVQRSIPLTELMKSPETPVEVVSPISEFISATDWGTFTHYWWNGFWMVQVPGSTRQTVKYDHPDNYYYSLYHPEEFNLHWYYRVPGSRYTAHHLSQSEVSTARMWSSLWGVVLTMIGDMIIIYKFFIYPAVTMAVAALGALIAILGIYQLFYWLWVDLVLTAEKGDGFSYSYAWPDGWVSCSYGGWKDLWVRSYYTGGSL